jgi:hypothetical protein
MVYEHCTFPYLSTLQSEFITFAVRYMKQQIFIVKSIVRKETCRKCVQALHAQLGADTILPSIADKMKHEVEKALV